MLEVVGLSPLSESERLYCRYIPVCTVKFGSAAPLVLASQYLKNNEKE